MMRDDSLNWFCWFVVCLLLAIIVYSAVEETVTTALHNQPQQLLGTTGLSPEVLRQCEPPIGHTRSTRCAIYRAPVHDSPLFMRYAQCDTGVAFIMRPSQNVCDAHLVVHATLSEQRQ